MKQVLSIAGFDPSSGAGVTADLMVFAAHGLYGTCCITGLTVQSTMGVRSSHPLAPDLIAETLSCLDADLSATGIKIGMLGDLKAVEVVVTFLESIRHRGSLTPVVVDPVLRSSSGMSLLDPEGASMLRSRLLPLADWITPNLEELAWLTGKPVSNREQMRDAAIELQQAIARSSLHGINVLAKGGHLATPDDLLLTSQGESHWLSGQRVETSSTHGTGCALSSALVCRLVLGDDAYAAARNAKLYVAEALRSAAPIGHGRGPVNHLWPLRAARKQMRG